MIFIIKLQNILSDMIHADVIRFKEINIIIK